MRDYSETRIAAISNSISAIFSSFLPTVVILVLYFVKSMLVRIVLMIVFTAIFSLSLSIFTEGKKVEIFAATAAYDPLAASIETRDANEGRFAAVEVVFIGGTSTNSTS